MSTEHIVITVTGGGFDVIGLLLVASPDYWADAKRVGRRRLAWIARQRDALAARLRRLMRRRTTIYADVALATGIGTASTISSVVTRGRPEDDWTVEKIVEWLIERVVPMRDELDEVRELLGRDMPRLEARIDSAVNDLRAHVTSRVEAAQREYLRARRAGIIFVGIGLALGVAANLVP